MALTPEEKTQKQIDTAVKSAVKTEQTRVKTALGNALATAKEAKDKAAIAALKGVQDALKAAATA